MKNTFNRFNFKTIAVCSVLLFFMLPTAPRLSAQNRLNIKSIPPSPPPLPVLEKNLHQWMKAGTIPGLTLVIIGAAGDYGPVFIKGYGYADLEKRSPITSATLFQLASCSKAFTALALLQLDAQGVVKLDSTVSDYFPWFSVKFKKQRYNITLRQLLHHSSGIPAHALSLIPSGRQKNTLEQIVKNVNGIELNHIPGEFFRYSSINYDILGAVIEKVTGRPFEAYTKNYLLLPLGLINTHVGVEVTKKSPLMASGYKQGFFLPRKYDPPLFRGNNPAAYIVSNGKDVARWLQIQMGLIKTSIHPLLQISHEPDLTVPPSDDSTSYAMGWVKNLYRNGETFHTGLNPNFTSYIGFRPKEKLGVAVLANCNSEVTAYIGDSIMKLLTRQKISPLRSSGDRVDMFCSIISFVLGLYILAVILMLITRFIEVFKGTCIYEPLTGKKVLQMLLSLLGVIPFLFGIYLIPQAMARMPWKLALVWAPFSFKVATLILLAVLGISYINYFFSLFYPAKNKYRNEIPLIVIISILSGLAGTGVLFIITTSFFSSVGLEYLLYYFALAYLLNVGGRKIAQTKMINISNHIALNLRIDLINRLFSTKYQEFEKIQDGRVFTTLNSDTEVIGRSAAFVINISTNLITLLSGFVYMITISLLSTLVVIAVVVVVILYNRLVAKHSRFYLEEARNSQNTYMSLLNGMTRGYKELSIHRQKKYEFKQDLVQTSKINCDKNIMAAIKFLNANLVSDSIGLIVLGILSIVISRVITGVSIFTLISFVMVLLYLLGPLRAIINLIPNITLLKVSWDRIKGFVEEIDRGKNPDSVNEFIKNLDLAEKKETIDLSELNRIQKDVENINVDGLVFQYDGDNGNHGFSVGPIDLQVNKGEALFIIGGNGSGKTSLAKLITGLYQYDKGGIKINNEEVASTLIGEYFSTIYSDFHLFQKIYGIDLSKNEKEQQIKQFLKLLKLEEKVELKKGAFNTLDLSGGQRKRLALLQCWLEDRPIYLFDEVAADQDPEFRKFFYHDLLVKMKQRGKIIIAITHDDHYFDVADKIIKMDMGKIDYLKIRE